mgnify:CR=1 FL=1
MRGGSREGAGRKPIENPRRRLVLYVTDEERIKVSSYLEDLRLPQKMAELEVLEEELQEILETAATGETAVTIESSAVESKEDLNAAEKKKYAPKIATAAEIVEIERLNHKMTTGKWSCIAGIMNRKLRYNEQLEPWTAETIKKAFLKARKALA